MVGNSTLVHLNTLAGAIESNRDGSSCIIPVATVYQNECTKLEEILAAICGGFPALWPAVLRKTRQVVHTGLQHFHAFFGRHPPRLVGVEFPDIKGEGSAVHGEEILKLCQPNRRNEAVKLGSLYGLRWSSLPQVPCKNWAWSGFRVEEKSEELAYLLCDEEWFLEPTRSTTA